MQSERSHSIRHSKVVGAPKVGEQSTENRAQHREVAGNQWKVASSMATRPEIETRGSWNARDYSSWMNRAQIARVATNDWSRNGEKTWGSHGSRAINLWTSRDAEEGSDASRKLK